MIESTGAVSRYWQKKFGPVSAFRLALWRMYTMRGFPLDEIATRLGWDDARVHTCLTDGLPLTVEEFGAILTAMDGDCEINVK